MCLCLQLLICNSINKILKKGGKLFQTLQMFNGDELFSGRTCPTLSVTISRFLSMQIHLILNYP